MENFNPLQIHKRYALHVQQNVKFVPS